MGGIGVRDGETLMAVPGPNRHDIELIVPDETPAEPEKPRSKLRVTAVMTALYVRCIYSYLLEIPLMMPEWQLAMFIQALDQTVVATSIPTIADDLHSTSGYVWIGGAYFLSNAAAGPIWAKVSDIFGRKPIILTANAVFFASSIFCAKSSTMKMLIVGRTFQGIASGGLVPMFMITVADLLAFGMSSTALS